MNQAQMDSCVLVQPRDVLVFYRNQSQSESAATISITRLSSYAKSIRYELKTTNKKAYRVSSTQGVLPSNQTRVFIYVIINQDAPLEKCLLDHFKLILYIDENTKVIEKSFGVIIDYKKESKLRPGSSSQVETSSYASGSLASTTATILNYSIDMSHKQERKQYRLNNYLRQGIKEKVDLQQQLDYLMKAVQDKRLSLSYLRQEQLKNTFRKQFRFYIIILVIICGLLLGMLSRFIFKISLKGLGSIF